MIVYINNVYRYSEYYAVTIEVVSAVLQSQVSENFLRSTPMISSVNMPSWRVAAVVLTTTLLSLTITHITKIIIHNHQHSWLSSIIQ